MNRLIEVRDAHLIYRPSSPFPQTGLNGASLTVQQGELIAFIGATGSGKSSMLQMLAGLLLPAAASSLVRVLDIDLTNPRIRERDLDRLRRRVAIAMQRPEDMLFKTFVGDDVAFGPSNYGVKGKELAHKVKHAMEQVGLSYQVFKDRRTSTLSGGEKRKVALAGVLALEPQVLLLHEPGAGLDPQSSAELLLLVAALRQSGMTIIFSTHDMNQAVTADRIALFHQGKVRECLPPADLFSRTELLAETSMEEPDALLLASQLRGAGIPLQAPAIAASPAAMAGLILSSLGRERGRP